ncbi:MAG: DUF5119 domain-containing protein [Bacteroidales bacterium]
MKCIVLSRILWIFLTCLLTISCERRQLEDRPLNIEYAEIELKVIWNEYDDEPPKEATALIYQFLNSDSKLPTKNKLVNTAIISDDRKCIVRLPKGDYAFIVANGKTDEASTFFAKEYDSFETMVVRLTDIDGPTYDHPETNKVFVANPEFLAVDANNRYTVTEQMISETRTRKVTKNTDPVDVINFEPVQITRTVNVEIHVKGLNNLKFAEVIASGGYRGVYPANRHTTDVIRNKFFEITSYEFYPNNLYDGVIRGFFTTFGAGEVTGRAISTKDNADLTPIELTVFFTLKDKEQTIEIRQFDVTDQYNKEGSENLHISLVLDQVITLPDIEIEGGTDSGFNPDVDDWGDGEEVDVPVK